MQGDEAGRIPLRTVVTAYCMARTDLRGLITRETALATQGQHPLDPRSDGANDDCNAGAGPVDTAGTHGRYHRSRSC